MKVRLVLFSPSPATRASGVTQAGVLPLWRRLIRPFSVGVCKWRNRRPRRARNAASRSRQRTPSSSAMAVSVTSTAVGLVC